MPQKLKFQVSGRKICIFSGNFLLQSMACSREMKNLTFKVYILGALSAISNGSSLIKYGTTMRPGFKRNEGFILPFDGQWSNWAPSSECSVTCEVGTMTEMRVCSPPVGGGAPCVGERTRSVVCSTETLCLQGLIIVPIFHYLIYYVRRII